MGLLKSIQDAVTYRGLIKQLVIRDLKLRYERSVLGFVWTLLNPLVLIGVYTFVFSLVMKSGIHNYPVFLVSVLLPWNFLVRVLLGIAPLPYQNGYLLNRAVFPSEALVFGGILAAFVEFLFEMLIFVGLMIAFHVPVLPGLYILPIAILIHLLFVTGIALFFAVAYVYFRDTQYLASLLCTAWFFLTPIFYAADAVPKAYKLIYEMNPMLYISEMFRLPVYNLTVPSPHTFIVSAVVGLGTFLIGWGFFNSRKWEFPELV